LTSAPTADLAAERATAKRAIVPVVLRPATRSDFEALGARLPYRVRAFAAERAGELLGIGGLIFLPSGTVGAFVLLKDGARKYAIALHKAGLRTLEEARRLGIRRVVAIAEEGVPPARGWLLRLGFQPLDIDGNEVFVWQDQP
jgi:GNAT superfamily N-acetyltransferase